MKLLAKRPADRYQSAKEVADLLEQWLAHTQRPLSIPRPNMPLADIRPSEHSDNAEPLATETEQPPSDQFSPVDRTTSEAVASSSPGFWADYSRTAPFAGRLAKVFDLATATLTAAGFTLTDTSGSHLSFAGPGLIQVRQNTLATASSIQLTREGRHLTLVAELGTMRKLHRNLILIPFICAVVTVLICVLSNWNYQLVPGNLLIATLPVLFSATIVGFSIVRGRKVARQTLDRLFENLINSGQSSQPGEIASQTPGTRWVEQFQNSWRETFCNRIYGTTALIWAAWVVFLLDSSRNFILFAHWIAIVTLCLGVAWPAAIMTFAWLQQLRRGTWEGTVIPRGPRHFLLRPFMILFVFAGAYWGWQQMTCGTIAFDIDDREFTVSLMGPSLDSSQNFSADFHPLRVRAGTYNWGIRHSRDLIATGQIEVDPLQEYTIRFRSPYPIGQADIQCLPGRWELTVSYNGSSAFMTKTAIPTEIESSTKTVEFMDVTEDELRVHSGRLKALLNTVTGLGNLRTVNFEEFAVYRFRATRPSDGLRGPSWFDLIRHNPQTHEDDVVAHGIFTADRKHLSFQLGPADAPRPTWSTPYDKGVLMLQFERASDKTLLQGTWLVDSDSKPATRENVSISPARQFPVGMTFTGSHFEARYIAPASGTVDAGTFSLNTTHDPKQITFSTSPLEGLVRITAGVFRFVDDNHIKLHLSADEKAPPGFEPLPGSKSRSLNLTRAKD
jgi:hypothetical protein